MFQKNSDSCKQRLVTMERVSQGEQVAAEMSFVRQVRARTFRTEDMFLARTYFTQHYR
jgi:hypothetical protein